MVFPCTHRAAKTWRHGGPHAPVKLVWVEALSISDELFSERFGWSVAPGWIGFPEALPHALEAVRRTDEDVWGSHLIFDDEVLVGFGGFKGPPRDGIVEIGLASVAVTSGSGRCHSCDPATGSAGRHSAGIETVIAHTLAEFNPSTTVLQRCGFLRVTTTRNT